MNEVKPVWIAFIDRDIKQRVIKPAFPYQIEAYYTFMSDPEKKVLDINNGGYVFKIKPFGKKEYPSFCILVNDRQENNILSNDKEALEKYVADENAIKAAARESQRPGYRATQLKRFHANSGGNRKKHSRNRKTKRSKRSKRVHTAKRK